VYYTDRIVLYSRFCSISSNHETNMLYAGIANCWWIAPGE